MGNECYKRFSPPVSPARACKKREEGGERKALEAEESKRGYVFAIFVT